MAIETDIRRSIGERAKQFVLFVREARIIATQFRDELTNAGSIRAARVVQLQNALAQVKTNITNWPYGSLINAAVRTRVAQEYPDTYASAAAVQTDIQATNVLFNAFTTEMDALIALANGRGQLYSSDPVTNLETYQTLDAPDTDAALAAANALISGINGA